VIQVCTVYLPDSKKLSVRREEILRYLRASKSTVETDLLIDECLKEALEIISPKSVYIKTCVDVLENDIVKFDFAEVKSHNLAKNLEKCKKAYVFCATIGIELDRLIEKYSKFSQSKATVLHAIGSALIEEFCDYVNDFLVGNEKATRRFSPGYGDLSLDFQPIVLNALDAERKIGIILGSSLLMQPSKSVTAIIGIE
jgi:hypothetical protein